MIVVADNVMYVFSHSISGLVLGLHFWILVTVDLYVVVTPRVCGGVKQLLLFVCQSVCLSVRPSFCPFRARDLQGLVIAQPGRNIAIWKKNDENLPDSDQGGLYSQHLQLFLIQRGKVRHFYGWKRKYGRGRAYAVSGHVHGLNLEYTWSIHAQAWIFKEIESVLLNCFGTRQLTVCCKVRAVAMQAV